MKRVAASFAVLALTAAGVVAAQTTSPPAPPSDRPAYPSNSTTTTTQSSTTTTTSKSHDQQLKDCMAQQQANNPNMSKGDMKKACKAQMHSSSGSPQQ